MTTTMTTALISPRSLSARIDPTNQAQVIIAPLRRCYLFVWDGVSSAKRGMTASKVFPSSSTS